MADKPKKGKGKLVGKKKAVKKAKPSAAPVEQGSGLNVESKPRVTSSDFKSKHEKALSSFPRKVPEQKHIFETPGEIVLDAPEYKHSGNNNKHEMHGEFKKRRTYLGQRAFNKAFQQRKRFQDNKDYAKMQSEASKTEAPAFGPRNTAENPVESLRKETKDQARAGEHKFPAMKVPKPKEAPSFQGAMKAGKERKAANKGLLEGMAKGARDFPGPKDEKKQMAAMDMTSKMAKAGKAVLDAQEKNVKGEAAKVDPLAAQMSASAKSFTGPTASQKVIAGMSEAGQQAKDKKQKKLDAFKNIGAKAKSAFTGPNKPKKSEKFLSGIENLFGEIDAHNNKKSGKPYSLPKSPANFRQNAKNAFQKMKADSSNKGKAASDPTLKNPFSGRTKQSSKAKHNSPERGPIYKGGRANDKKRNAEKPVSALKKEVAAPQSSSPSLASKVGGAIKSVATHPTTTGFLKATGVHLGMAAMHGSNYPQKMHEYASRGPREFRPGWHGFTSPVEKPHAGEATDTKEERA